MENQAILDQLQELSSMPAEQVKDPTMPVDVFLQEAENLYHWIQPDKEALVQAGLSEDLLEDLNLRASLLRHAQGVWTKELNSRQEAAQLWKEKSPAAFELRDNIVHTFLYAYRKHDAVLEQTRNVAEGAGAPDMIQDLVNLAYIGNGNPEPLQAINFDFTQLEKGVDTAEEMADLLARVNGEKGSEKEPKLMRDRAFWFLKEAVDEIRACGKYLFWKNPEKVKGYTSAYYKK